MIRDLFPHLPNQIVARGAAGDRIAADLCADASKVAKTVRVASKGEVLLICDDRYHFVVGLLGAWLGGRAVRLPPNGQPETLARLAAMPGTAAFLHDRPDSPLGTDLGSILASAPDLDLVSSRPELPAELPIATLATSGTTGDYQFCPKTAAQLLGETTAQVALHGIGPGARILATVPPHHIYGLLFSVLVPLRVGGSFVRESPVHAEEIETLVCKHAITHLVSVPAHLQAIGESTSGPLVLERIFSSGAPLPRATALAVRSVLGLPVTEIFGSTETGGIAWRDSPDASWRPLPGVQVSANPDGRLLLESLFLPPGTPRPYACQDLIELAADGSFSLLGRLDGLVKVAGKRIALAELEARTLSLPGVRDATALAQAAEGVRGEEIWLAVVGLGWEPGGLRRELARWFDPTTLPRRIRVLAELPRDENGKLPRQRMHEIFEAPENPVLDVRTLSETETQRDDGTVEWTVELEVPVDLHWFRGHFAGDPVMPGVVQLHRVVQRRAAQRWPDLPPLRRVARLKFKRIIRPGAHLTLRLVRPQASPRVDFEIQEAGQCCASGTLHFGLETPP